MSEVDEESDIGLGKRVFWFVSGSLFSLDEARTDSLHTDVMFLRNEQNTLVGEFIHKVLLDTLETVVIAWDTNFICKRAC